MLDAKLPGLFLVRTVAEQGHCGAGMHLRGPGLPQGCPLRPPQQVQGSPEGHLSSISVVLSAPAAYS